MTLPLFSLETGTAAFAEEAPIDPERRIFIQSMPAWVLAGVRSIGSGLLLRRSLGELKRTLDISHNHDRNTAMMPLSEIERKVVEELRTPMTIEAFLRHFQTESTVAARIVIAMLTLGVFRAYEKKQADVAADDVEKDLALLAAIGSQDPRSLRAVALSRQLPKMTYYDLLDVPRAATRNQITARADEMRTAYSPTGYPPMVRESVQQILRKVDDAATTLRDPVRRAEYDKLLAQTGHDDTDLTLQQRLTRSAIAEKNLQKARELSVALDYYGAIVLLKQAVNFAPDNAEAWFLLGNCQQQNPRWLRDAAESYHQVLALNPNHMDALLSLGDLYRSQGLISRAQSCYEDALQIDKDNVEAAGRLKALRKK